eukprot:1135126-Rhodomonas_salina.1
MERRLLKAASGSSDDTRHEFSSKPTRTASHPPALHASDSSAPTSVLSTTEKSADATRTCPRAPPSAPAAPTERGGGGGPGCCRRWR